MRPNQNIKVMQGNGKRSIKRGNDVPSFINSNRSMNRWSLAKAERGCVTVEFMRPGLRQKNIQLTKSQKSAVRDDA